MFARLTAWLFGHHPPSPPTPDQAHFARWRHQIAPFGDVCGEILYCLGGSDPQTPGYFDPFTDQPLDQAILAYFIHAEHQYRARGPHIAPDIGCALYAAGRLVCGQLDTLPTILDHAPLAPIRLNHGAGHCNRVPWRAILHACPLPEHLVASAAWVHDSPSLAALREWYEREHQHLAWDASLRRYQRRGD